MGRSCDVVIVGGNATGLALALALARSGLGVTVIERQAGGGADASGRAYAISLSSKNLLAALGLWERLAPLSQAVAGIDITDSSLDAGVRPVLLSYVNAVDGQEAASFIVPAAALADVLAAAVAAEAGIVRRNDDVVGWDGSGGAARITTRGGGVVEAPLAVAADGRRSALRRLAGIKSIGWSMGQTAIVTTIRHEIPHHGRAVQHFLPSGPFAILPLPGNRACITWSEKTAVVRAVLALDDARFLAEVDRRVGGRLGTLALDGGRGAWPLELHLARSFVAPRLALVGDAAHGVHPIAGQGLNLGLRDVAAIAEIVVERVRAGLDPGGFDGIERYERWRRFDAVSAALAFEALNRLFSSDLVLLRSLREFGLGLVDRLPFMKGLLVREAAGMTGALPKLLTGVMP